LWGVGQVNGSSFSCEAPLSVTVALVLGDAVAPCPVLPGACTPTALWCTAPEGAGYVHGPRASRSAAVPPHGRGPAAPQPCGRAC
jgi:hypothetical protein